MSDGPHRSLEMRKGWKRVAESADNRAFEPCSSPKPQPTEKSITQLLGSHQLFWYNSLPCFDSADFSLERSFASFARTEASSSKIWLYVNNSPF